MLFEDHFNGSELPYMNGLPFATNAEVGKNCTHLLPERYSNLQRRSETFFQSSTLF